MNLETLAGCQVGILQGSINIQSVESGRQITHQRHQEERGLEDMFFNKSEPIDKLVIPADTVKGKDK